VFFEILIKTAFSCPKTCICQKKAVPLQPESMKRYENCPKDTISACANIADNQQLQH
jgi:hypothetical protein